MYQTGEFVDKNNEKAEFWLIKAGNAGDIGAQYNLGHFYTDKNDINQAIYWYRKAAEQGDHYSQFNLANLLLESDVYDPNEVAGLYEKALLNTDNPSNIYGPLGWLYINEGSLNKQQRGIALLNLAIEYQDHQAEFIIGELYEQGELVPKDLSKAYELYQKAAKCGLPEAIEKLKEPKFN